MFTHHKKNGGIEYYMVFKNRTKNSIIAHECMHATNEVFKRMGIEPDLSNDEPQAYLLGWFVEQCEKFLK